MENVDVKETEVVSSTEETIDYKSLLEQKQNDYNSILGRFKTQNEQINALKQKAEQVEIKESSNQSLQEKLTTLQEKVQKQEQRAERLTRAAKRQSIVSAMVESGGDPILVEMAADSILSSSTTIEAIENDNGSYDVNYVDAAGMQTPITDYIKNQYMQTKIGKKIVTPKQNPSVGGNLKSGVESQEMIEITPMQANDLTYEQLNSGRYRIKKT